MRKIFVRGLVKAPQGVSETYVIQEQMFSQEAQSSNPFQIYFFSMQAFCIIFPLYAIGLAA